LLRSLRDAETLLIQRKRERDQGKEPEIKKIANHSFKELAEEYLKWAERQRSYSNKCYYIEALVKEFNLPLRKFNTKLIEQFQTKLLNQGLKPATANRYLATLKHMFTKASEWEMVEEHVLKRIKKVKFLPENNRRLRYLSKEECRELTNACEPHLKPIVVMALNTGMRKGEILSLKWENVDLNHGFILLDRSKNGDRREIPINETLRATLKGIIRRIDVPYVFYDLKTGNPYKDVKRAFKTALRRSKMADFRFHDLRHTFASHLVMAGVDLTTIKELLGHKNLTMTLRYAHLAPAHKVKAVDLLDTTLNQRPTIQKLYSPKEKGLTVSANPLILNGGRYGDRTHDLQSAILALSQLS
jgi:integrase